MPMFRSEAPHKTITPAVCCGVLLFGISSVTRRKAACRSGAVIAAGSYQAKCKFEKMLQANHTGILTKSARHKVSIKPSSASTTAMTNFARASVARLASSWAEGARHLIKK